MDKRTRSYGVVAPDVLKSFDGLGFLRGIVNGTVPNPPISELLGFHLVEVEEGRAVFEGTPEFRHYNPIGTCMAASPRRCSIPRWAARYFPQSEKAIPGPPSNSNSIWCVR